MRFFYNGMARPLVQCRSYQDGGGSTPATCHWMAEPPPELLVQIQDEQEAIAKKLTDAAPEPEHQYHCRRADRHEGTCPMLTESRAADFGLRRDAGCRCQHT